MSGDIAEGRLLPREATLAEQFSVSRQAVREALKVLAAKGLVVSRRRTGTCVLPRSSWNLLDPDVLAWHPPQRLATRLLADIEELRRLIEPAAASFAATRGDDAGIAAIGAALEEMRRTTSTPAAFRNADAGFHVAVFAASGNEFIGRLSDILGPLLQASFRLQHEAGGTDIGESVVPLHEAIYQAIVAHDGEAARQQMENLLEVASRQISKFGFR